MVLYRWMGYMDGDIFGNEDNLEVANPFEYMEVYFDLGFIYYCISGLSMREYMGWEDGYV